MLVIFSIAGTFTANAHNRWTRMQQYYWFPMTILSDEHLFPHLLLDDIMNHLTLDLSAAVCHKIQAGWMKAPY